MNHYLSFIALSATTVILPGPAVLMTLCNSLTAGWRAACYGVAGLAFGVACLGMLVLGGVASWIGASDPALGPMRFMAAIFLAYLGARLWQAPPLQALPTGGGVASKWRCFGRGVMLQFLNPYSLAFVITVLPQFIDPSQTLPPQCAALLVTHAALVVLIHCSYALAAERARHWLTTARGAYLMRRVAALTYFGFSASFLLRAS